MQLIYMFFLALISITAYAEPEIRISIGVSAPKVEIHAAELTATWAEGGKPKLFRDTLILKANSSGIVVDGVPSGAQIVTIASPGLISLDSRQYRGVIEFRWQLEKGVAKLSAIHPVPLETYVVGIISSEVPKSWPLEVLRAQAIAARTYAVWQKFRRLDRPYHMESSVLDQVYGGVQREHSLAEQAVQSTYGEVLTYEAKPIQAYFHSTCGGHTEDAKESMGVSFPYLKGVKCGYCSNAATAKWEYHMTREQLGKITDISIVDKTEMGRAKTMKILSRGGHKEVISGTTFRERLGYFNLRSTWLDSIKVGKHGATFKGRGFGHGSGMCQFGAMGMARAGFVAEKILAHYYPGTEIRRMY